MCLLEIFDCISVKSLVGLSNKGSEDPGDPSHSRYCDENTPKAGLLIGSGSTLNISKYISM